MNGIRENRRFPVWTEDGQQEELIEYRKLIDVTDHHSTQREIVEGNKPHFITASGEPAELVSPGVYELAGGVILREGGASCPP